ncbi:MAG: transcriptional regulator, AraC family [Paenibacillaceae bacterium]|jgi:AraC-like DNA-binding protein|nr:transcriptional regulator, AraC family [Paenibacillaceae bacterium]
MFFQRLFPPPVLSPYIESFLVQEDFNPTNYANRNSVKVLPTSMTVIGIQYGEPMRRLENRIAYEMGVSGITGMQSTVKEYVSTGAIGTLIIQFKPGGLSQFTKYPIHEFKNANVPLELVFPARSVHEMEERLACAGAAAERVGVVQQFLVSLLRDKEEEQPVLLAARHIMTRHGAVSVEGLAAQLYMSKRTLERKFNALVGASPKMYASIIRFQHAIALRSNGCDYLDIVHACGYADQAHFAKDFRAFAGCTPEQFFHSEFQPELKKVFNKTEAPSGLNQSMYY